MKTYNVKEYHDYVYDIVKEACDGFDSVYEDHILELVGINGLNALIANRLVETCGVLNGRQLYVVVKRES